MKIIQMGRTNYLAYLEYQAANRLEPTDKKGEAEAISNEYQGLTQSEDRAELDDIGRPLNSSVKISDSKEGQYGKIFARTLKNELIEFVVDSDGIKSFFQGKRLYLPREMQKINSIQIAECFTKNHWFKLSNDSQYLEANGRLLGGIKSNPGPKQRKTAGSQATSLTANTNQSVGAQAVGAQAVGAQAVGAQAVGAQAVGAQAVGAQAVGAQATGAQAMAAQVNIAQAVGAQAVGAQATVFQAVGVQAVGAQASVGQAHLFQACGADAQLYGARVAGVCGLQVCPANLCGADVGIPGVCGTACVIS